LAERPFFSMAGILDEGDFVPNAERMGVARASRQFAGVSIDLRERISPPYTPTDMVPADHRPAPAAKGVSFGFMHTAIPGLPSCGRDAVRRAACRRELPHARRRPHAAGSAGAERQDAGLLPAHAGRGGGAAAAWQRGALQASMAGVPSQPGVFRPVPHRHRHQARGLRGLRPRGAGSFVRVRGAAGSVTEDASGLPHWRRHQKSRCRGMGFSRS
jgi:hypothetical protein